jgi:hypothetical protein
MWVVELELEQRGAAEMDVDGKRIREKVFALFECYNPDKMEGLTWGQEERLLLQHH